MRTGHITTFLMAVLLISLTSLSCQALSAMTGSKTPKSATNASALTSSQSEYGKPRMTSSGHLSTSHMSAEEYDYYMAQKQREDDAIANERREVYEKEAANEDQKAIDHYGSRCAFSAKPEYELQCIDSCYEDSAISTYMDRVVRTCVKKGSIPLNSFYYGDFRKKYLQLSPNPKIKIDYVANDFKGAEEYLYFLNIKESTATLKENTGRLLHFKPLDFSFEKIGDIHECLLANTEEPPLNLCGYDENRKRMLRESCLNHYYNSPQALLNKYPADGSLEIASIRLRMTFYDAFTHPLDKSKLDAIDDARKEYSDTLAGLKISKAREMVERNRGKMGRERFEAEQKIITLYSEAISLMPTNLEWIKERNSIVTAYNKDLRAIELERARIMKEKYKKPSFSEASSRASKTAKNQSKNPSSKVSVKCSNSISLQALSGYNDIYSSKPEHVSYQWIIDCNVCQPNAFGVTKCARTTIGI